MTPRTLLLALSFALPAAALAQGALTPPGAPAPTMKSLTELDASLTALTAKAESRIAIDTLPGDASALRIISAPGSYYLRGNLSTASDTVSAIRVATDGVVIDLNGFTLTGSGATSNGNAINTTSSTLTRLVVRNGTLTGWFTGVHQANGVLVEDLVITNCRRSGVEALLNSVVRNVQVSGVGYFGIMGGVVENCRVVNVGGYGANAYGIYGTVVRGCTVDTVFATGASYAYGILAAQVEGSRVGGITSAANVWGIEAGGTYGAYGTVRDCTVENLSGTGAASDVVGVAAYQISGSTVSILNNTGDTTWGISANSCENCFVTNVDSSAASIGGTFGIRSTLARGNRVHSVAGSALETTGIFGTAIFGNVVTNIVPTANTGYGIRLGSDGIARDNSVNNIRTYGISAGTNSLVAGNTIRIVGTDAAVTTGAGILSANSGCRIEGNLIYGGPGADYGIRVSSVGSFIVGNRCYQTFTGALTGAGGVDTPEFNIGANNRFGPIVSTFAATGEITATNPFSNFSD